MIIVTMVYAYLVNSESIKYVYVAWYMNKNQFHVELSIVLLHSLLFEDLVLSVIGL